MSIMFLVLVGVAVDVGGTSRCVAGCHNRTAFVRLGPRPWRL